MQLYPAVAIDGPAASGKSTVARLVAAELGYTFVNSGAMYRAFTWYALQKHLDLADAAALVKAIGDFKLECRIEDARCELYLDGVHLDEQLSSTEVNSNVSRVAAVAELRSHLVQMQRDLRKLGAVVMEGRDIGSVVFTDTPLKFYIDASPEVRAQRRAAQGIIDSISERDRQDSSRATAPLTIAEGAIVIDSSHMNQQQVADAVVAHIKNILSAC